MMPAHAGSCQFIFRQVKSFVIVRLQVCSEVEDPVQHIVGLIIWRCSTIICAGMMQSTTIKTPFDGKGTGRGR